jgi:transposase
VANQINSELKTYFPLALQILDNETSTVLAADLLLQWPCLEAIQKQSEHKLRKFFYGHNCRGEARMLERLAAIKQAKALTCDLAVIEPAALKTQMLAEQLKSLLSYIACYEKQIAQLFGSHPDRFLFDNLPGAGAALAPRLLTAFGSDRSRFESAESFSSLTGIAPIRIASGKRATVHFRHACPKFLRQSLHEFAACSMRYCDWAKAFYDAQIAHGKTHHVAVRALAFKWIRILFSCWKKRIPYNPERYLCELKKRGSLYAKT